MRHPTTEDVNLTMAGEARPNPFPGLTTASPRQSLLLLHFGRIKTLP